MHFGNFVRSFDVFGEPVSLNYKGEQSFKTIIGALFTLVLKLFIIFYAATALLDMFARANP